jgi:hypothetical protein
LATGAKIATNVCLSGEAFLGAGSGSLLSFSVSRDSTQLQNVSIGLPLGCSPSSKLNDHLSIADIAIASDGAFSSTTTQTGVISGFAAHFTYTFNGHFHGFSAAGRQRAAGQLREDVTYTNGTTYSCTTNSPSWSATR